VCGSPYFPTDKESLTNASDCIVSGSSSSFLLPQYVTGPSWESSYAHKWGSPQK